MLGVTLVLFGLVIGSLGFEWHDKHGYPFFVGPSGGAIFACGIWPLAMSVTLVLGLAKKLPGTRKPSPGRCPACGYDVSTLEVDSARAITCPECGRSVRDGTR
jgi:hypothetical protein